MAITAEDLCYRKEVILEELYPPFRDKVLDALQICIDDGYIYIPTSAYRTVQEQAKLYAQGRTRPGKIVTGVLRSFHNYGLGIDCCPHNGEFKGKLNPNYDGDYEPYMLAAETVGLYPGGRWKKPDLPHLQYCPNDMLKVLNKIYDKGGLKAVWSYLGQVNGG